MLSFSSFSQYSFNGKVFEKTNTNPLAGAHVSLNGTFANIPTKTDGSFEFKNLKAGDYTLQISYLGYKTIDKTITVSANLKMDFFMEETTILEDEVVISATRASASTGTAFTNIDKVKLKTADIGTDLPYMLEMTPSMVSSSDAGAGVGYTSFRIRGTDMTRINITINGIPLNDPESQNTYFVDLQEFASSLNNVQIQRGVGTSTNGSGAFGASIDLQTTGITQSPSAEISASYGSFNSQRYRFQTSTGLIDNKFVFDARLSKITSDGYIDRASSNLGSYYVSGAWYGKRSILRLNVFSGHERTYQAWSGVPKDSLATNPTYNPYTYKDEVDDYTQTHYQLIFTKEFSKKLTFNSALHYTRGYGFYENYGYGESYSGFGLTSPIIGGDTVDETDLIQRKLLDNHFYGAVFSFNYNTHEKLQLVLGGAINQFDGDHFGQVIWAQNGGFDKDFEWYRNNGFKTDFNIYLKATYKINKKLSAFGDVQYRGINYSIDGIHDDLRDISGVYKYNFVNPKFGLLHKFNPQNSIYASFAVANKEPGRGNFRDADDGETPRAENLKDFEFGYTWKTNTKMLNINLYYMDYTDQLVETGKINNVGDPILINVENSYRQGIEIVGGWKPSKTFDWDFNITLSENKILDFTEYVDNWDNWGQDSAYLGTTDLAFSPSIIAKNSFNFHPVKNFDIALQTRYVGKQYIDNTSSDSRSLDAYLVNDLKINYKYVFKSRRFVNFNFAINNLLNEKYETYAWVYRYHTGGQEGVYDGYFPQAGINFFAGVSFGF